MFWPIDFSYRIGLLFVVEAASISAIAVTGLLLYIVGSAIWSRKWPMETQTHYYFVNLLIADLIQAIGEICNIKWVAEAKITEGHVCTMQGMLKQIGPVGVALTTLAIAIHTVLILVFHLRTRAEPALIVIGFIWLFIALAVGIGYGIHKGYYGYASYWCWITAKFTNERIGLEYLWLWLACFLNIILYVFLALVIKGVVIVENGRMRFRKSNEPRRAKFTSSRGDHADASAVAMRMLL
jgi:hypothetical protein